MSPAGETSTQEKRKLPIGMQTFRRLREEGWWTSTTNPSWMH